MVADRNSTHASANSQRPSRRVYLPDQRSGSRTVLGADRKGNAGSSSLSSGGQSGGGSRSLAQSGGSPRTPQRDLAGSISTEPVLRKGRGQQQDHDGPDERSGRADPSLAERRTQVRLADDGSGDTGPESVVELEAVGHEQRQNHGG